MRIIFAVLAISFAFGPVVSADIYKYVDHNGVTVYTDNLAEVPPDQRHNVPSFKEINSPETHVVSDTRPDIKGTKANNAATLNRQNKAGQGTLSGHQRLEQKKKTLDQEYENLVRQRQALKKENPDLTTAKGLEEYRKKVMALNGQIKDFETRRKAFALEAAQFNSENNP